MKLYNKKIMIIDECKAMRDVISSICSRCGATTVTANNSREGVLRAIKDRPHLIILHPGSERRSGFFSYKFLKYHSETSHIPILLCTADHAAPYSMDDVKIKFDDYILKPFGSEKLIEKIEKLLNIKGNVQPV